VHSTDAQGLRAAENFSRVKDPPSPTFRLNDVAIQAAYRMSVSSQKPGRMIARTNAHNYDKNAVTVNYAS
jgi:hypothetical protein